MTYNYGTKDSLYRNASDKWDKVDALMAGTDGMRAAGESFLPKFSLEDNENYTSRLNTSTLFNAYKKALETNVGKITSRPVQINDGSEQLIEFTKNVDSTGRGLNEFTKDVLLSSMNHGVSFIFVDFPKDGDEGRPNFIDIDAQQLMSVRTEMVNGKQELTYFKYSTSSQTTYTGWDNMSDSWNVLIREYAVLDGKVLFRVKQESDNGTYVTIEEGEMDGLSFIPVVPVYSNRTDFFVGEPLLNDLAELNIRHWQSSSDQQWILHYARSPILFLKGMESLDENGQPIQVNVGPNSVLTSDRTDADAKYVEHNGNAIEAGRKDLIDLQEQMEVLGMDISVNRTGSQTATGQAINAAATDSILKSIAIQMQDSLHAALSMVEFYYGNTDAFIVDVNQEYIPMFNDNEMGDIWEMYRRQLITASDVLAEAKRRNLLTPQHIIDPKFKDQLSIDQNNTE